MKTALLSVWNKKGIIKFARQLQDRGFRIVSSGGTEKVLKESGVEVTGISDLTGFPECLDGRVKTLHPSVHAGILARRDLSSHMSKLVDLGIDTLDLVAVNLYPFKETISKENCTLDEAIENIDIGGPAMLRSAAKNYSSVIVIADPADYELVARELDNGGPSQEQRLRLSAKAFRHTAAYDSLISSYLSQKCDEELTESMTLSLEKVQDLRYGENPHQRAALYRFPLREPLGGYDQIQGKELSFNNLTDAGAALELLREFSGETVIIGLKHANPCGVGVGKTLSEAWFKAYECDPVSIFGGIVATNSVVDEEVAIELKGVFLEIIIAYEFTEAALQVLASKKNLRLLRLKRESKRDRLDFKAIPGGMVVQERDMLLMKDEMKLVTKIEPGIAEIDDLLFAWKIVKHVKSNAVVIAKDLRTLGIGPGQTNRIWALENAIRQSKTDLRGAVLASDAFFPFADCVESAAKAGISAIIQPGGSIRDADSIEMANRYGISMLFTGMRHFNH